MWSTLARHGQASQGEPNPELFSGLASRGPGSDESVAPPGLSDAGGGGTECHDDDDKLRRAQSAVKPDPGTVSTRGPTYAPVHRILSDSPFQEDPPNESVEAGR